MGERVKTRLAAAVVAMTLVLHVFSVAARIGREPSVDEIEYLHVSWLMAHGQTIYQSFFEHHSPLLFAIFVPFAPGELADPRPFVTTARAIAGAAGLAAMTLLAIVAWRFSPVAAGVAVSSVYAAEWIWVMGLAEARAEPFGLMLLWTAIALLFLPRRSSAVRIGIALGLLAVTALLIPKWPLVTAVFGIYALVQLVPLGWRRVASALGVAAALAGTAMAALLALARFGDWWFTSFPFNVALARWAAASPDIDAYFRTYARFSHLPWFAQPLVVLVVALLVVREDRRLIVVAIALAAALAENRFLHAYPHLWPHYFILPAMLAALLLGMVPHAVERWLPRAHAVLSLAVLLLAAGAALMASLPWMQIHSPYWVSAARMRQRLRPGDTVWVDTPDHPITVRDAHYYWFVPGPVSAAVQAAGGEWRGAKELPICAAASGADPAVRFISTVQTRELPGELRCLQRMLAEGRLRPAERQGMYEVVR